MSQTYDILHTNPNAPLVEYAVFEEGFPGPFGLCTGRGPIKAPHKFAKKMKFYLSIYLFYLFIYMCIYLML